MFNEVYPVLTDQGNNFGMPPEYNYIHAAQSPPQLPDPLHRMAKAHSHRLPDLLPRKPSEDEEREHYGDTAQEADPVRGVCSAHGGHKTAERRDVRRTRGGCSFFVREGKGVNGVLLGRSELSVSRPTSG